MTEAEVRVPTADALLAEVREGVEAVVRDALEAATNLHEEAAATLERYDGITSELTRLKSEIHGLHHEAAEIPARLAKANLDSLIPDSGGEDAEDLQRRYIAARERLPVAEARIARLESELSSLVSGGSRPAQVNPNGGQRKLLKHNATSPALDALNEAMATLNDLHEALEEVVPLGGEELRRVRQRVADSQNTLWGQAKVPR